MKWEMREGKCINKYFMLDLIFFFEGRWTLILFIGSSYLKIKNRELNQTILV